MALLYITKDSEGFFIYQPKEYMKDGWLIKESHTNNYILLEIPKYGGYPQYINSFSSLKVAYDYVIEKLI